MKILFFSPVKINLSGQDIKGTGNWVNSLIEAMTKISPEIKICVAYHCKKIRNISISDNDNILIAVIPTRHNRTIAGKIYDNWIVKDHYKNSLKDYLNIIKQFEPDLIQLFGLEHPYIRIIGETDIPVVIHLQGMIGPYYIKDLSNKRFSHWARIKAMGLRNLLIGNFLSLQNIGIRRHLKLEESLYHKIQYVFGRTEWDRMFSKAISPNAKYFFCQEILRAVFYDNIWKPNNNKTFKIFSTLSCSPRKNIDIVFRSAKILEKNHPNFDFQWQIAGADSTCQILKLVKSDNLISKRVSLLGNMNGLELISCMLGSDLFVFPTAIDNSPNALQEATLLGMPIISTNTGGIPSIIEHNKTGILVSEADPYSLAGAIIEIANSEKNAEKMGERARLVARERNNPINVVKSLINNYETIINNSYQRN
jgi:glycosyltransferase involved in cell wall biosynthesis